MNPEYELSYWIFHWVGAFIVFAFGAIGYAIGHRIDDDLSKRIGCMCIVSSLLFPGVTSWKYFEHKPGENPLQSFVWEIWVLIIFVSALHFLIEELKN